MPTTPEILIAATGVCTPKLVPVAEAVAAGMCSERDARDADLVSISLSDGQAPGEMAVSAANSALKASAASIALEDVGLVIHSDVYYQGAELWPVASYVQNHTVGGSGPAFEIRQMSNGAMASIATAAALLPTLSHGSAALLTTGDRFDLPGFDRWRSDPGTAYADGGTALILSTQVGWARVRSQSMSADASLEPMHRSNPEFAVSPLSAKHPIGFGDSLKRFKADHPKGTAAARTAAAQDHSVQTALAAAGIELAGVDWFILPHFGRRRLQALYFDKWGVNVERTNWRWARMIGHLGAGDQFASLHCLQQSGLASPGQMVMVVGVGGGFSWSTAIIEIL